MSYLILTGLNISVLENRVNTYLSRGYIPQGGIMISGTTCAQAIYKPPKDDPR